jgi:hypothetical protein
VYDKGGAANTWLKDIPFAMQKGAAVEVCVMKRGLLRLATICKDALVYPDMVGTLREDDVVAIFYPNHKTTIFADGPGANPRAAVRVFQKITDAGDESCWERRELLFYGPIAKACFSKIDTTRIENILVHDFGPRTGLAHVDDEESVAGPVENVWAMESKRSPGAATPEVSTTKPAIGSAIPEVVTAKAPTDGTVTPASENKVTY